MKKQIDLSITGMGCNHCVMTIKNALAGQSGVKDVKVDFDNKEAKITANDDVTPDSLISIIKDLGYSAAVK